MTKKDIAMSIAQLDALQSSETTVIPLSLHMSADVQEKVPAHLKDTPFRLSFIYGTQEQQPIQWLLKRTIDISVALLSILILAIPFLFIALIVKIDSKGPLFFKQKRIGVHGKRFHMYKIRSMHIDAEERLAELLKHNEIQSGMFKMQNDPRVTKVGRFLRKYSLDELPQLLNVLKGEMSLVGPRPPVERELQDYQDWHYIRFSVLPGLTGEWQVSGRSKIQQFDDVVNLDFKYIRNWNLAQDFKIILKTIPVVLLGQDTA
jgi:lipopolysaccharide/colanic/teichoic acid biosynthesis glycosyltransferase